jgi:hypothetical protein
MAEPLIPALFASYYSIVAMLFVGLVVEKYYVNRPNLFLNSAALLVHAKQFPEVGISIAVYVILGIVVALIGFVTYMTGESLPDGFYQFAYFTYSSLHVALLMVLTLIFSPKIIWLGLALLAGALLNSKLLTLVPTKIAPVERFELAVELADFLFGESWRY